MTEDERFGWHHWLYGHEFEQAPGVGDGQGGLVLGRYLQDSTLAPGIVTFPEISSPHSIFGCLLSDNDHSPNSKMAPL